MSLVINRLMDNVRTHLPGAVDTAIKLELFNVLNDFFQNSHAWTEDVPFGVTPSATQYSIEQESLATISQLMGVVNSAQLPVAGVMPVPGEILLRDAPSQSDTYTATVVLTVADPVSSKTGLPEFPAWVLDNYFTGILDGLLGRMMAQPAKPYSNPQLALVRTRSFKSTTAQAKTDALNKNLNNGQTWRFPQHFATRRGGWR